MIDVEAPHCPPGCLPTGSATPGRFDKDPRKSYPTAIIARQDSSQDCNPGPAPLSESRLQIYVSIRASPLENVEGACDH